MFSLSLTFFLICQLGMFNHVIGSNMNGDIYGISNPDILSSNQFSTKFLEINNSSEYFDVYSHPITSRYGDVYWTMMQPVLLPNNIVKRFNNKVIAIVGYEVDQVFIENGKDISVPITWTYNHHYEAYLTNSDSQFVKANQSAKDNDWGVYNHGAKKFWDVYSNSSTKLGNGVANTLFFSEGNGGEYRASFHGYPNNYAQLLYSPRYFNLQPMQIDTRNRDPKYINDSVFHAGLLPKRSAAPINADYSGLLECPCTTRINKTIIHNYDSQTNGYCDKNIMNVTECYNQAVILNGGSNSIKNASIIKNADYPSGCFFVRDKNGEMVNISLNMYNSNFECGKDSKVFNGEILSDPITNVGLNISISDHVTITMRGPSNLWYGVAFNAHVMADLPYAIIVNGTGDVFEDKLGNHDPGVVLPSSIKVLANCVKDNIRTVIITRPLVGTYYSFNVSKSTIPILSAVGQTGKFGYHNLKSSNTISLKSVDGTTCICDNGISGKINGISFSKNCALEPTGDLVRQKNPTCNIETYQGGLSCCHHKNVLLDKDQVQPDHEMTYYLKFRFWFQEYKKQLSLVRFYFQTEAFSGEYDIPKCASGIPPEECIHSITAHWQARDMVNRNEIGKSSGLKLIYAGPHCHAPTCISMQLYNADTGQLICMVNGDLGEGRDNIRYDEKGYIRLNPCLWGDDAGLLEPRFISWDTNLTSIKLNNNTYAHYGEMASWQMRGTIVSWGNNVFPHTPLLGEQRVPPYPLRGSEIASLQI